MAIDSDLLELMSDSVTIYAHSSVDAYGKRTASGSGTTYDCRVIYKNQLMKDNNGREVLSMGRVIVPNALSGITTNAKITLPDGTNPPIISISRLTDETSSNHHSVVMFGA
jgi:hypothetical protein